MRCYLVTLLYRKNDNLERKEEYVQAMNAVEALGKAVNGLGHQNIVELKVTRNG